MNTEPLKFFGFVNETECFLYKLSKEDPKLYFRLRDEASLLEVEDRDYDIFDCVFTQDPRIIRHTWDTVEIPKTRSDFDLARERLGGERLRFWRDLLRGDVSVEAERELLYLNYFTLFAARTPKGSGIDINMLNNTHYLEGQFLREKELARALTLDPLKSGNSYTMEVVRVGDSQRAALEKNNLFLKERIKMLGGVSGNEE
jgi:hypothetical protein